MKSEPTFEQEVTIRNTMGLHARPAAQLVKIASGYDARLIIGKVDGDEEADCRSVLSLLMLAAGKGSRLLLQATGPEAEPAFRAVLEFFEANFGEE